MFEGLLRHPFIEEEVRVILAGFVALEYESKAGRQMQMEATAGLARSYHRVASWLSRQPSQGGKWLGCADAIGDDGSCGLFVLSQQGLGLCLSEWSCSWGEAHHPTAGRLC